MDEKPGAGHLLVALPPWFGCARQGDHLGGDKESRTTRENARHGSVKATFRHHLSQNLIVSDGLTPFFSTVSTLQK
jgi:hypothetical protein